MAVTHAQFESVHPFVDGNGRTERAIYQVLLKQAELSIIPIAMGLLAVREIYYKALNLYCSGDPSLIILLHTHSIITASLATKNALSAKNIPLKELGKRISDLNGA